VATIYVCRKCKHSKDLQKAIERGTDASVRLVGCQDVCKQPVAGARVDGSLQWFGGLDQSKRQRAFIDLVNGRGNGKLPDVLAKTRVAKRAGKSPR
jgi:hypothetical protein